jgi:hypothetical protein
MAFVLLNMNFIQVLRFIRNSRNVNIFYSNIKYIEYAI